MDWIFKDESSPAILEASGDSETDSLLIAPSMTAGFDDDDAESCSGRSGDDNDASPRDERKMSWRSWLVEYASQCKHMKFDDEQEGDRLCTHGTTEDNGLMPMEEEKSMMARERESAHASPLAYGALQFFRLYDFTEKGNVDPSLNATYVAFSKIQCKNLSDNTIAVPMKPTSSTTSNIRRNENLKLHQWLFQSDVALLTNHY
uniref:Uncharacterized protein LOC105059992 n=1 Tax=Elaeis guineensis var. tenera TaxID=51953 RepID=A0A6I9SE63_ELAGV|nr:uncharacterized protein LOC105059992 [Elaeis guineensis]